MELEIELTILATYLAIVLSVAVTQALVIFNECHDNCRGYLWRALGQIWPFFIGALVVQSLLAYCLYEFAMVPWLGSRDPVSRVASAGVSGFVAVAVPNGVILRGIARYLKKPSVDLVNDLEKPLSRFILWTWVMRHFKAAAQLLKSHDNFDYQFQEGSWNFSFSTNKKEAEKIAARRLRMLFELQKAEIANKRRQPELLNMDVNFFPGNRFFLIVAHLGRKRLRRLLREPLQSSAVFQNWDGSERRKVKGRKRDRAQPDPNDGVSRIGDDKTNLQLVKDGRLF